VLYLLFNSYHSVQRRWEDTQSRTIGRCPCLEQ